MFITLSVLALANVLFKPTMKIKRTAIENIYESKLDAWYESKTKVIWEE